MLVAYFDFSKGITIETTLVNQTTSSNIAQSAALFCLFVSFISQSQNIS
jgi:hypothetical protein